MRKNQGITLIALIITIIVMLILVAVSVNILIKSNLIGAAEKATDKYKTATKEEANSGTIEINGRKYNSIDDYINGKEYINWNEILADATTNPNKYKHPDQSSSNGDIGIGTDGKPVNLDLWTYGTRGSNDQEINLSGNESCNNSPGYKNSNITETGEIIGKVPQYIKLAGNTEFFPVVSMSFTFGGCTSLTTAPEIPNSVTNMSDTFIGCTSLTTAPEIPNSVTNMSGTFSGCTSLTTAPEIPTSVTNMSDTFSGCTSLTTAPEIPNGVTNMSSTFFDCTSLTTAPEIPTSVTNMNCTFVECANLTTAPEIPTSVTNMSGTFGGCTSLTTAPEIPTSVTNMSGTFSGCTSLTTAPEIPTSVTNMSDTFSGCTSLTTAPEIPNGVTNMGYTFYDCTKLQGTIKIDANPTRYDGCFESAATEGTGLVVTGSSTKLDEIIATGDTSKITKGQ